MLYYIESYKTEYDGKKAGLIYIHRNWENFVKERVKEISHIDNLEFQDIDIANRKTVNDDVRNIGVKLIDDGVEIILMAVEKGGLK